MIGTASAGANVRTITGSNGDVQVTAQIYVPDGGQSVSVRLGHNGTSVSLTSARIRVMDPRGEQIYARETPFEFDSGGVWDAVGFELPRALDLGRYLVSFDAIVDVETEAGSVEVRVAGTDVVEFFVRSSATLSDFQTTPPNVPAGEKVVVSGIALRGSSGSTPLVDEPVQIWFDPKGTAPRVYRGSATPDARGYFEKTLVAPSDGTWRAVVPKSDRYVESTPADATQETRVINRAVRSGSAVKAVGAYSGGVRVIAPDVVIGLHSVTARFDLAFVGFGGTRSSSHMSIESRRGEGMYPDGAGFSPMLHWPQTVLPDGSVAPESQSDHAEVRISPWMPAGVYDVGIGAQHVAVCTAVPLFGRGGCPTRFVLADPTITTMTVKRASSTTVSASAKTFTGPKTITLSGAVRKVQLVGNTKVANRLSPNTPVKLYFDPAGSAGPVYKKTVKTGSAGTYSTKVGTSISGRWIAEYPGTALQAPSQHAVTITVR
ncbi:hypothetical protein [Promicromonospora sp. NPDC059942]|uniref:hypothetical protein n=1 Tax=Promicromonospora sp. NPDC059942 TaxID=3347009 RepID=UPI003648F1F6